MKGPSIFQVTCTAYLKLQQLLSPQALSIFLGQVCILWYVVPPLLSHDTGQSMHQRVILCSYLSLTVFLHLLCPVVTLEKRPCGASGDQSLLHNETTSLVDLFATYHVCITPPKHAGDE